MMPEKEISEAGVTLGWSVLTAIVGAVGGALATAYRSGRQGQAVLSEIKSLREDVQEVKADLKSGMETLHTRSNTNAKDIARIKGQMK